jgi:myosin-1
MDLQFDFNGDPIGGFVTTYLLEKARVVRQAADERNFHVLYQLLAGGRGKEFGIGSDGYKYRYLNQGGVQRVAGMDDKKEFNEMSKGLKEVGFTQADETAMLEILAVVLYLGEVKLVEKSGGGSQIDGEVPAKLLELLGVDKVTFEAAVTNNTRVVSGAQTASPLAPGQAQDAVDSLAKALYQRTFQWVCTKINASLASTEPVAAVIGVLDIYGFEIMATNSFEQFCINYCNESLQQLFIELTLKTEQDEYLAEGIEWTPIEFFNNKIICDLIDKRPKGIIALLDEESIRPGDPSDDSWYVHGGGGGGGFEDNTPEI